MPIFMSSMNWCLNWGRSWDYKLTPAPTTDAGAMNQVGGRWWVERAFFDLSLNSVDLDKSTEVRIGLNQQGLWYFTLHTLKLLAHPPKVCKRKWSWASSGPLAILLVHQAIPKCTPLLWAFGCVLGSDNPFRCCFAHPQVLDFWWLHKNQ